MLTFRNFEMSDLPFLRELIADARYGNSFSIMSPERAEQCFRYIAGQFLVRCTYAEVCEVDGVPAGVLLGVADGERVLFDSGSFPTKDVVPWWLGLSLFKLLKAKDSLIEECDARGFDSEMRLCLTDEKFRGQGVNSALLERFAAYVRETGHKYVFIRIDESENAEQYLKCGFKEEFSIERTILLKERKFIILSKKL